MDQQIGHEEHRIILALAYAQLHRGAVLFHHHSVKSQRLCHPLIFLYTAVIMGVQVCQAAVLIERILLYVDPGAVNMSSQNVDALFHGLLSHLEHHNGLIHPHAVDFVPLLELLSSLDQALQFPVSTGLDGIHNGVNTLPLRLAVVQELPVRRIEFFQLFQLSLIISLPSNLSFHFLFLSFHNYYSTNGAFPQQSFYFLTAAAQCPSAPGHLKSSS